jgi:hypothetical protein
MTNPIRWWLTKLVHFYLWWTRLDRPNPKPMKAPRYKCGHLKGESETCGDLYCR